MVLKDPGKYEKGKTIVLLVRHGDRVEAPELKDAGHVVPGPKLSKLGIMQARDVAKKLEKIMDQIDVFYCSNMTRAMETAEEISKKIGMKPKVVPDLSEFNGTKVWGTKIHTPGFWKNYLLHKKSLRAFNHILEKNRGKVILIVAHGNVIKGLVFRKMGLSFKKAGIFNHNNCHITKVRFSGKKVDYVYYYNSRDIADEANEFKVR